LKANPNVLLAPRQATYLRANVGDSGVYLAMLAIIVVLAYLFHLPLEAQLYRLRALIERGLFCSDARHRAVA